MAEKFVKLKFDYGLESKIYDGYELFELAGVATGTYNTPLLISTLKVKIDADAPRYQALYRTVLICAEDSVNVIVSVPRG